MEELPDGVTEKRHQVGAFTVTHMRIATAEAARLLEKEQGRYTTVELARRVDLLSGEERALLSHLLAGEIRASCRRLTGYFPHSDMQIFVAGLGNAELTADALGPMTVRGLVSTRHLSTQMPDLYHAVGCASLCALAPGVLGQTGIETLELLKNVCDVVSPQIVIVIDALAARSCARLAATVQITDTGISPGSGVGNHRSSISQKTLGAPVLAIGVPTVVNSSTLVWDALSKAGISTCDEGLHRVLREGESFFVSPKESDLICARMSSVLSRALGLAFLGELAEES